MARSVCAVAFILKMPQTEETKRKRRRTAIDKALEPLWNQYPCSHSARQALVLCHEAVVAQLAVEHVMDRKEESLSDEWVMPAKKAAAERQTAAQVASQTKPSTQELQKAQEELLAASRAKLLLAEKG